MSTSYVLFVHFLEPWLCRSSGTARKSEGSVPNCSYDGTRQTGTERYLSIEWSFTFPCSEMFQSLKLVLKYTIVLDHHACQTC